MKYSYVCLLILTFYCYEIFDLCLASSKFEDWLVNVKKEAVKRGIKESTVNETLTGIKPIPRVIELDRKQPEFTLTFKQYLSRVVSENRIRKGRSRIKIHERLLTKISNIYKVQPRFIVALWGIETDFGRITGGFPVIASLATLAHDGRRSSFFRRELMFALEIIDKGHITNELMVGSWAGAMGQNQFMPSSFHTFAVDYDRDGKKDIWNNLPDIFASIANYLKKSGWRHDITWGRGVEIPENFPRKFIGKKIKKKLVAWQSLGIRKLGGRNLPSRDLLASIISPEKTSIRPAFLAYHNFNVILRWNRSDYFAVAVGTLSDRIRPN